MRRYHVIGILVGFLVAVVAIAGMSAAVLGQPAPGDVGSYGCLMVQQEAQDAVDVGMPYKNHGQMVRTAANVVSPYEEAMGITEECASCIMNQFARSILIEEQATCGPLMPYCEPAGVCGGFTSCQDDVCPPPAGAPAGNNGICFTNYEGGGVCLHDYWCAGVTECPDGPSDCGVGEVCIVDSCCTVNTCVPAEYFCWPE